MRSEGSFFFSHSGIFFIAKSCERLVVVLLAQSDHRGLSGIAYEEKPSPGAVRIGQLSFDKPRPFILYFDP